jgi:hypothetical protein
MEEELQVAADNSFQMEFMEWSVSRVQMRAELTFGWVCPVDIYRSCTCLQKEVV